MTALLRRALSWLLVVAIATAAPASATTFPAVGHHGLMKGFSKAQSAAACTSIPTTNALLDINPSDTSKLFQTIAGTTAVTTDGDPVGTAQDANGNGFNLTALADTGVRPLWNTSAGLEWLTYSGDDVLKRAAQLTWFSGVASTIALAIRHTASAQGVVVSEGSSSSNTPRYTPTRNNVSDFNDIEATAVRDDGTFMLNNTALYDEGYPASTDVTVIITDSGTSIKAYIDGVAGTAASYSRGGTTTLDLFALGARARATHDNYYVGRIYRAVVYNYVMSAGEISNMDACLKATQGR